MAELGNFRAPAATTTTSATAAAPAVNATAGTTGFAFTRQDVEQSAKDLIAAAYRVCDPDSKRGLPEPAPVQSAGVRRAIAVAGPKGGKTIASLAVKTSKSPGLPRPAGSIVVCLHLDNQAPSSWENFLWDNDITVEDSEQPYFIGLGDPIGHYKGRVRRNDPACSAYVRDVIIEIERLLGERGDVGLFVFDGYGDTWNQYGGYVAAYECGKSSAIDVEGTEWYPRREMATDLIRGGMSATCAGGYAVFNGPSGGFDSEKKDAASLQKFKKRLAKEGFANGNEPPAKWLLYRENNENMSAIFEMTKGTDDVGEPTYVSEIWEGRMAQIGIRTGRVLDITGGSVGKFCEGDFTPGGAAE